MSDIVHNERAKLLANALDRASTAMLAVGVLGPLVSLTFGMSSVGSRSSLPTLIISTILWMSAAIMFHLMARIVLGRLR